MRFCLKSHIAVRVFLYCFEGFSFKTQQLSSHLNNVMSHNEKIHNPLLSKCQFSTKLNCWPLEMDTTGC